MGGIVLYGHVALVFAVFVLWLLELTYDMNTLVRRLAGSVSEQSARPDFTHTILQLFYWNYFKQCTLALTVAFVAVQCFFDTSGNARLMFLLKTFNRGLEAWAHLAICMTVGFLGFALVAYVLFGNDVKAFSSIFASCTCSLDMVFGGLDVYVDAFTHAQASHKLPSGLPLNVLLIWMFFHQFLIRIVVVNVFICILIRSATTVREELDGDPRSVPFWVQLRSMLRMRVSRHEVQGVEDKSVDVCEWENGTLEDKLTILLERYEAAASENDAKDAPAHLRDMAEVLDSMDVVLANVERTQEDILSSLTALQDVSVVSLNAGKSKLSKHVAGKAAKA